MLSKTIIVMMVDLTNGYSSFSRCFLLLMSISTSMAIDIVLQPYRFKGICNKIPQFFEMKMTCTTYLGACFFHDVMRLSFELDNVDKSKILSF